jgi:hypothetical protein
MTKEIAIKIMATKTMQDNFVAEYANKYHTWSDLVNIAIGFLSGCNESETAEQ